MADDSGPDRPRRITDRDLARLMRRGTDELADDPAATEVYERIRTREEMEEDRTHRQRSERSAAIGFVAGLALLAALFLYFLVSY